MSGPNTARWRDAIIRRLHEKPDGFWLNEVLGVTYSWPEYVALHHASGLLKADGRIKATVKHERRTGDRTWVGKGRKKLPTLAPEEYLNFRVKLDELRAKEQG